MATAYKMTGSGNDFIMFDGRETTRAEWPAERIARICNRRYGIGADGLVILTSEGPDRVRMDFFNADGTEPGMCGNAALCSTRLSARLELGGPDLTLVTGSGMVRGRALDRGDLAELELEVARWPGPVPGLEPGPGEHFIRLGVVGVPHLVVRVDDVVAVDVEERGRRLRSAPALGPPGANVNFVSPPTQESGGRWRIRTFERGVEGETLACGTGTVTAGLALIDDGEATSPVPFVSWGGDPLEVRAEKTAQAGNTVWLAGQGRLVFIAELPSGL